VSTGGWRGRSSRPPTRSASASVPARSCWTRPVPVQVVYVACDPVALARDVATFADLGYRLEGLRAVDLFPHTHHLEAVARLVPVG
jgi:hypothetical protein